MDRVFAKTTFRILALTVLQILLTDPGRYCRADTFTNAETGEVFHGFATQKKIGKKTVVRLSEKGFQQLDLSKYKIERNSIGRNNTVITVAINEPIMYQAETEAFKKAIIKASNMGPLLIIVEIDCPGGRVDLCAQMCETLAATDNCTVVAFIAGGKYGGAYSAAAATALACEKIYMAPGTAIGAATPYMISKTGLKESTDEIFSAMKEMFAYLAAKNRRPQLLAMGMVDKDIEVVEISKNGKRFFTDTEKILEKSEIIHTWTKKGSLVTLPASDAVECNIADGLAISQKKLLEEFGLASAKVMANRKPAKIRQKIEKAKTRIEKTLADADYQMQKLSTKARSWNEAAQTTARLTIELREAIKLAETFPDTGYNPEPLKQALKKVLVYSDKLHSRGNRYRRR